MNPANINVRDHIDHTFRMVKSANSDMSVQDPAAVKALLDQLRASQVWQDTLKFSSSHISSERRAEPREPPCALEDGQGDPSAQSSANATPSTSVASLLSQLRTSEWTSAATNLPLLSNARMSSSNIPCDRPSHDLPPTPPEHRTLQSAVTTSSTHAQDIRSMSFQQALPHLTKLASDPEFLITVSRLRQEQNSLEQQLWEERLVIRKEHEEKVKVARTKATLIGAGLSKHETDMMNDAYRLDLQKFDKERVLLAWDALIQKQQEALETLGVPTMFATTAQADCQKQRKVIQVLEGL